MKNKKYDNMNFNLDMPIENEKEDKLNRNKFAKNLADAILKQ